MNAPRGVSDGFHFCLKLGNYGVFVTIWCCDPMFLGRRTGFGIWWKKPMPVREEYWRWITDFPGQAAFQWDRFKDGVKVDGFSLRGPLVTFSGKGTA